MGAIRKIFFRLEINRAIRSSTQFFEPEMSWCVIAWRHTPLEGEFWQRQQNDLMYLFLFPSGYMDFGLRSSQA